MGLMGVFQKEQDEKCPLANNQRVSTVCWRDFSNVMLLRLHNLTKILETVTVLKSYQKIAQTR